jgi:hypothetical protein
MLEKTEVSMKNGQSTFYVNSPSLDFLHFNPFRNVLILESVVPVFAEIKKITFIQINSPKAIHPNTTCLFLFESKYTCTCISNNTITEYIHFL